MDTALEEMLHNTREGLSVGQSSSSVSERTERSVGERTGKPVGPSGQELNVGTAVLDRQKEQILAECQAEIQKYECQANYDRRSVQKLSEIFESQQDELHCSQAEELQRRDQQLLQEQFFAQNRDLRETHEKSLSEMEEFEAISRLNLRHNCEEELHFLKVEKLHRRIQQLFHEQLLQQNPDRREAHHQCYNKMDE